MTETMTVPTYATPVHHATLVLGLELVPDPKMKFLSTMGQVCTGTSGDKGGCTGGKGSVTPKGSAGVGVSAGNSSGDGPNQISDGLA